MSKKLQESSSLEQVLQVFASLLIYTVPECSWLSPLAAPSIPRCPAGALGCSCLPGSHHAPIPPPFLPLYWTLLPASIFFTWRAETFWLSNFTTFLNNSFISPLWLSCFKCPFEPRLEDVLVWSEELSVGSSPTEHSHSFFQYCYCLSCFNHSQVLDTDTVQESQCE